MLIAARSSFLACRHGWKNPYVTDGLLAMWDSIWNAGCGKHDPGAGTWKDLAGNSDINLANANVYSAYVSIPRNKTISITVPGFDSATCSIEILTSAFNVSRSVVLLNNSSAQRYISCRDSSSTTSSRIIINMPYSSGSQNTYNFGSTGYYDFTRPHLFSMCGRYATSGASRGFYVDGQAIGYSNYGGSTKTAQQTATLGGEQNVRCVRVYSRTITAAEIAANLAIDKERYGLP